MICKSKSGVVQLGLVLGLMLLAGGATLAQDVKYNFMPGTNFSKYHSYKWISIPENVHPSQIVDQETRANKRSIGRIVVLTELDLVLPSSI
jgi:hypothetical protein